MILDQLPNVSEAFRQTYEIATNIITSGPAKAAALTALGVGGVVAFYSYVEWAAKDELASKQHLSLAVQDSRRRRTARQRAAVRSAKLRGALQSLVSLIH